MNLNQYLKLAGVERPLAYGEFVPIRLPGGSDPRDYQVTGLNRALREHWFGLWDDPGLGKTLISQAWACYWAPGMCCASAS